MNSIYQPSVMQQLQMLKEQTRLTGGLHEAQVLQLKAWPLVVFNVKRGKDAAFTWDPDKHIVAFSITGSEKHDQGWWQKRTNILGLWVKNLLGNDWKTNVKVGDRIFRSKTISGANKV
jgi:hypothetical protein